MDPPRTAHLDDDSSKVAGEDYDLSDGNSYNSSRGGGGGGGRGETSVPRVSRTKGGPSRYNNPTPSFQGEVIKLSFDPNQNPYGIIMIEVPTKQFEWHGLKKYECKSVLIMYPVASIVDGESVSAKPINASSTRDGYVEFGGIVVTEPSCYSQAFRGRENISSFNKALAATMGDCQQREDAVTKTLLSHVNRVRKNTILVIPNKRVFCNEYIQNDPDIVPSDKYTISTFVTPVPVKHPRLTQSAPSAYCVWEIVEQRTVYDINTNVDKSPTRPSAMELMDKMFGVGGGHGARNGGGGDHGMRDGDNDRSGYGGGLGRDGRKPSRYGGGMGGTGGHRGSGNGGDHRSSSHDERGGSSNGKRSRLYSSIQ